MGYKLKLDFVEYGKRFLSDGAKGYEELSHSPNLKGEANNYKDWLGIPGKTRISKRVGEISVALISNTGSYNADYLFSQIHWRSEDEFSRDSPTDRSVEQIRFTALRRDQIKLAYTQGYELWLGLLENKEDKNLNKRFQLRKYTEKDTARETEYQVNLFKPDEREYSLWNYQKPYLLQFLDGECEKTVLYQIQAIADEVVIRDYVEVRCTGLNLETKMLLVEAVQRLVFPKIGVLTFALDYVTDTKVRLQFIERDPLPIASEPYVLDLDKNDFFVDLKGFSSWMLKIFSQLHRENTQITWEESNDALFDPVLEIALKQGATAEEACYVLALHKLSESDEIKNWTGHDPIELLAQLRIYLDDALYISLLEKFIIEEGKFDLFEFKTREEFIHFLELILQPQYIKKLKQHSSEFRDFASKGQHILGVPIVSSIGNLSTSLLDVCVKISSENTQFAEWFTYTELALSKNKEAIAKSLRTIANSLRKLPSLETSEYFKRLICFPNSDTLSLLDASKNIMPLFDASLSLSIEAESIAIIDIVYLLDNADNYPESLLQIVMSPKIYSFVMSDLPAEYTKKWLSWSKEYSQRDLYIKEEKDLLFDLALKQLEKNRFNDSWIQLLVYMIIAELTKQELYTEQDKYELFNKLINKYQESKDKTHKTILDRILRPHQATNYASIFHDNNNLLTYAVRYAIQEEYELSPRDFREFFHQYGEENLAEWIVLAADKTPTAFQNLSSRDCGWCLNTVKNSQLFFTVLNVIASLGELDSQLVRRILWEEIAYLNSWKAKNNIFSTLKQRGRNVPDLPLILQPKILTNYLMEAEGNETLFTLAIANAGDTERVLPELSPPDIRYLYRIAHAADTSDGQERARALYDELRRISGSDELDSILEYLKLRSKDKLSTDKGLPFWQNWFKQALESIWARRKQISLITFILILLPISIYLGYLLLSIVTQLFSMFWK